MACFVTSSSLLKAPIKRGLTSVLQQKWWTCIHVNSCGLAVIKTNRTSFASNSNQRHLLKNETEISPIEDTPSQVLGKQNLFLDKLKKTSSFEPNHSSQFSPAEICKDCVSSIATSDLGQNHHSYGSTLLTAVKHTHARVVLHTPNALLHTLPHIKPNILGPNKHASLPVLGSTHRKSQQHSSRFSTASWILESSPRSLQPYLRLIRFDKPIGTWLLYWPCTWSIALAAQPGALPDFKLLALFGAGAFFMRGAGCVINDMWDKDFDGRVERTKTRPLAAGEVTHFQALVFLGTQLSCALTILLQLNWYSVALGASSMVLVVLYPLAKRFTHWPQLVLGLTFNYGALLGYSAATGHVDWPICLPLYVSCILWTLVYDTIYAHQDKYDDVQIGVRSTAIALGDKTKPVLSVFTATMAAGLVTSGQMCDMTWPFYLAVGVTTARLYQQIYEINLDTPEECANAFKSNFYLGVVMLTGIILGNLIKQKPADNDGSLLQSESGEYLTAHDVVESADLGLAINSCKQYNDGKNQVYFMPK